jgi:hypothetical protein
VYVSSPLGTGVTSTSAEASYVFSAVATYAAAAPAQTSTASTTSHQRSRMVVM